MTPKEAYYKAKKLGKRMPYLEPLISKDSYWSYCYAKNVIKGRFSLAELHISKNAYSSYLYAYYVIKGKWILAEPAIGKDTYSSYYYARNIIKGRLPDFMHNALLLSNDEYVKKYIEFIK